MITRSKTPLGRALALCTTLTLAATLVAVPEPAAAAGLDGKVYFSLTKIKDVAPEALRRRFAKAKPGIEIARKDGGWKALLFGFFRRAAVAGPVTLWFFDKSDKGALKRREAMHIATAQEGANGKVLVYDMDLSENDGFNKNRTYVVRIGQIIGKRTKIYGTGEVKLLP